jgi:hypothetical protein
MLLGILEADDGHRAVAGRDLATAYALNPRQPVVADVRAQVLAGQKVDIRVVAAQLAAQLATRLKPTG